VALHPSRDAVHEKLESQPIVPVYRKFVADTITPVSAYLSLTEGGDHKGFLLESVEQGEQIGRYTFLSVEPRAELIHRGGEWSVTGDCDLDREEDPFDALGSLIDRWDVEVPEELPSLTGGLVGYVGYEMIRYIEPSVPVSPADESSMCPDSYLYLVDTMLIFDHVQRACYLVGHVHRDRSTDVDEQYEQVRETIEEWHQRLRQPTPAPDVVDPGATAAERVTSNFQKDDFQEAVKRLKSAIRAGDIFQAVPSQRFQLEDENDPFNIYRQLRSVNPSPYMYFLDFDDFQLVGSSPEILVRKTGDTVTVRPIAGTRRRGETDLEDRALEEELVSDEKEQAEHTMLVDLGRNDLGRVSQSGTVEVTDRAIVERYSHVMHLVSNVTGKLKSDLNAADVLRATFPAGTVTGAPKVRAMELVEEVEPDRRGPYAGAVGYMSYSGDMDTCIVIRTIIAEKGTIYVQAGAGIVADSEPEREYEETREKAQALLQAVDALPGTDFL
jgi:anthranilate synthase component 1